MNKVAFHIPMPVIIIPSIVVGLIFILPEILSFLLTIIEIAAFLAVFAVCLLVMS